MIDKDGTETRRPVDRAEFERLLDKVEALDSEVRHLMAKDQAPMKAQPDSDGWIPWGGGECPVDPEVIVEFKMRNLSGGSPAKAKFLRWPHENADDDIIAYRPAKQEAEWPQVGDTVFILCSGHPLPMVWMDDKSYKKDERDFLGIYPTREQAEEAAAKIKRIMEHLREGREVHLVDGGPGFAPDTLEEVIEL